MHKSLKIFKCCLSVLLCFSLLLALAACAKEVPEEPKPSESEQAQTFTSTDWDNVVAQFGNHILDSATFSYYYWSSYTSFLNYYGSEAQDMVDLYTPLDQQMYSEELTWQDYFIDNALMAFRQYSALNDLAAADGFELSQTAQDALANAEEELLGTAEAMGFETVEEYLQANYGTGATLENYLAYVRDSFVVQEYTKVLQDSFSYTDEEVEAYFDEHEDDYAANGILKRDVNMAQLRYLMILPADDSEESYNAIDEAFNEMLADWETWEDKSEEGFMAFGEKWSEKGFAQDYLDAVAPDTVYFSYFDDWVFDEPREQGDTRTYYMESGDYFFYYIRQLDEVFWRTQARYDMCHEAFTEFLLNKISNYTYVTHPENIIISQAEDLYEDYEDVYSMIEGLETE